MIKIVDSRKPHKCLICGQKIPIGKVLSLGFAWFCSWNCFSQFEAEMQKNE